MEFQLNQFLNHLEKEGIMEFIIKVLNQQQISISELNKFIYEYVVLMGLKEPSQSELSAIIQLIQMGYFNLNFAVDEASKKLNLNITRLYDQKNQLIKAYIQK